MRSFARGAVLFVHCVVLSSIAVAQVGTGSLNGSITDPSGAPIPGAAVVARHDSVLNTIYACDLPFGNNPDSGRVTAVQNGPRVIQLVARLNF